MHTVRFRSFAHLITHSRSLWAINTEYACDRRSQPLHVHLPSAIQGKCAGPLIALGQCSQWLA